MERPALLSLSLFLLLPLLASACNEAVCASIASKCILLKSCECNEEGMGEAAKAECLTKCRGCLDDLYAECCTCFEICQTRNVTEAIPESAVFEFKNPDPPLWNGLMGDGNDGGGDMGMWKKYNYPVDIHRSQLKVNALNLSI